MTQLPAYLQNRRSKAVAVEVAGGLGSAQPPHVSILGGRFTLVDAAGNKKPVDTTYLDCVIIDGKKGRSRVFWGVGAVYEGESGGPPLCFSDNDVGPSSASPQPQSNTCVACPMARWDSDVSKKTGKPVPACKTLKKLALMLPGFNFPFQLRVPVMSHSALQSYTANFRASDNEDEGYDVSDVVSRISFVEGETGELEFDFAQYNQPENEPFFIDATTMELRDDLLEAKKTDALIGRNDVPWSGALPAPREQAALAPPKPAAQAAPPPARPLVQPPVPQRPAFGAPAAAGFTAPAKPVRGRPRKPAEPAPNGGFQPRGNPKIETSSTMPQSENPAPSFGIQAGAEPSDELSQELDKVFQLPT